MYSVGSLKVKNLTFFGGRIKKFGAVFWNNDLSWVIILMCITLFNKIFFVGNELVFCSRFLFRREYDMRRTWALIERILI